MDNGAHFYRCDFQVHSPRDIQWDGDRPKTDAERKEFADEFVQACRLKGLDAVAITDHHDLAFFHYFKEAAERETQADGTPVAKERRLTIFPGIELTLGIPCQAILLLDADFPVEFLSIVLTAIGVTPAPAEEEKHAPIQKLDIMSFEELYDALNKQEPLRGHFTVFPHVADRGHQTLTRKGFEKHYASMPCVGGYVDGDLPEPPRGRGMRDIVNGRSKEWGSKPLGLFQTSDSRTSSFSKLGAHSTWVKWSEPTAEALRQACLARHSRISQSEPDLPASFITRVQVSNSKFLGPVALGLNRQYNALIGGRGTGKSTLLEYMRWALCDQPPVGVDGEEIPDFQARRKQLIERTLRSGDEVEVEFVANDIVHVVRRRAVSGETTIKVGNGEFRSCAADEVSGLLPVQAYSQKQLSNVGVKVEELNRFVRIPIRRELERVDSHISQLRNELRQAHIDVRAARKLEQEIVRSSLELESLQKQIEQLRNQLKGLSEEDRKVIKEQDKYSTEARLVDAWKTEWVHLLALIDTARKRISSWDAADFGDTPNRELLGEIHAEFAAVLGGIGTELAALDARLREESDGFALRAAVAKIAKWKELRDASQKAYEDAKARASAHQSTLKQIQEVERRIGELSEVSDAKKKLLESKSSASKVYESLVERWIEEHGKRTKALSVQCTRLGELSDGLVRANLVVGTDSAQAKLQARARGSGLRSEKIERLFEAIRRDEEPLVAWCEVLREIERLAELDAETAQTAALPSTGNLDKAGFTDREKRGLAARMNSEQWIDIFVTSLDDIPVFDYRAREGDYIEFSQASAGQQATALMSILLNQDGPPLIIDQPEDDLDNQVINSIVEAIWVAKGRRQLIFSSHNANLVVNGDAELVACFDYRVAGQQSAGKIKHEGAIDIQSVRDEITSVMEGGREAFALRQAKYGF